MEKKIEDMDNGLDFLVDKISYYLILLLLLSISKVLRILDSFNVFERESWALF